jgi:hypothetical protein
MNWASSGQSSDVKIEIDAHNVDCRAVDVVSDLFRANASQRHLIQYRSLTFQRCGQE